MSKAPTGRIDTRIDLLIWAIASSAFGYLSQFDGVDAMAGKCQR